MLLASIHACAPEPQKIFSRIGLAFAVGFAVVIGVDYFVQFAVVIPSLQSGETQGLSLFTQYNPHGLFIAGEALGYLMMSTALLFAAPVFAGGRPQRAIRWLFVASFVLAIAALAGFWLVGHDLVAFEVAVLSINWIVLIASGALLSIVFRRAARSTPTPAFSAAGVTLTIRGGRVIDGIDTGRKEEWMPQGRRGPCRSN